MENMIQTMNNEQIKTWYSSSQLNNYKNKGKPIRLKAFGNVVHIQTSYLDKQCNKIIALILLGTKFLHCL